jgi:hypothetical protein
MRTRARQLQRWNGRLYIVTALVISVGAIYMTWTQGDPFDAGPVAYAASLAANSLNGLLIILCAIFALRYALARRIDTHRRWALRTFLVASGVWFQRVGYAFWTIVTAGGAPGTTSHLNGAFDIFIQFARTVLPLVFLELYLRAQNANDSRAKWAMATVIDITNEQHIPYGLRFRRAVLEHRVESRARTLFRETTTGAMRDVSPVLEEGMSRCTDPCQ